jgi:hypothetical protein
LLIEQPGKNAAAGLETKALSVVQVVVIRERRFLIKRLHHVGHVFAVAGPLIRGKKARDSIHDGILASTILAS